MQMNQGQPAYYSGQPQYYQNNNNYKQQMRQNQDIENMQMMAFAASKGQQMHQQNQAKQQQQYDLYQQQQYDQQQQQKQQQQYSTNNKRQTVNDNQQVQDQQRINAQFGFGGLSDKSIRRGFIRKVLSIICIQLLITIAFIIPSTTSSAYRDFQVEHKFILIIAVILNIGTIITLCCFKKQCMIVPRNYILLFTFTITEGYLLSMVTAVSKPEIVLLSAGITLLIVFILTIYAVKTTTDITQKITAIIYVTIALLVLILVGSLFRSYIVQTIIGVAIVGVFSFYLVHSIQKLQGGRTYSYSYDDYIIAALDIYVDIIVIFQTILGIASRD